MITSAIFSYPEESVGIEIIMVWNLKLQKTETRIPDKETGITIINNYHFLSDYTIPWRITLWIYEKKKMEQ